MQETQLAVATNPENNSFIFGNVIQRNNISVWSPFSDDSDNVELCSQNGVIITLGAFDLNEAAKQNYIAKVNNSGLVHIDDIVPDVESGYQIGDTIENWVSYVKVM